MASNGFSCLQDLEESDDSEKELKKLDSNGSGEVDKKKKRKKKKKPKKKDDTGEGSEGDDDENGTVAAMAELQLKSGVPDLLTLEELAVHLATARAKYHKNTTIPDEAVCRLMLTTRMAGLPLNRCIAAPSSIPGAGQGLFVTRDVVEGELISLYPADAILIWEDEHHSQESAVQIFFGRHITAAERERDLTAAVTSWREYEVPCSSVLSIVGDPLRVSDPAYLGHLANDAASFTASSEEEAEQSATYLRASAAGANAEIMPFDVEELDPQGHPQVLHMALRALKNIKAGQEVFVSYGSGYWAMHAARTFIPPPPSV